MTLTEARAQLDILIDKVDQAYFTVLEKNTFLKVLFIGLVGKGLI